MTTRVVLNPHAGGCDDVSGTREALDALPGSDVRLTRAPGDAGELARRAVAEGAGLVVAAGGDGTVHEVVNGMADDFDAAELGIVPLGTANDFARGLELPMEMDGALEVLRGGTTRAVDLMELRRAGTGEAASPSDADDTDAPEGGSPEPRYAINVVVGGFGGSATAAVDEEQKRHWGSLAYLRSAIREMGSLPRFRARVEVDGRSRDRELLNVAVANGPFAGGHIPVAPGARPDDGRLEVVLLAAAGLGELAGVATRLVAGRPVESELVERLPGREVTIRSDPPMHFRADGEELGPGPLRIRIRSAALRVRVPG